MDYKYIHFNFGYIIFLPKRGDIFFVKKANSIIAVYRPVLETNTLSNINNFLRWALHVNLF